VKKWKNQEFLAWAERDPKTAFFALYGTLRLSCAQPTGNSFSPNQWHQWKAETLKVCLLLVWRVSEQAFGRYRLLNGAENWSSDITKIENLHRTTRRKIQWFQKCYSFQSVTKNNEVIAEQPFPNSGVTRRLWTLGRLEYACRQYILLVLLLLPRDMHS